jgi:hypothetical protein
MISIFTTPKTNGNEHIDIIQANALSSWGKLEPMPEITELVELPETQYGTPLVREVFKAGDASGSHDIVAYVNTDIILMQSWLDAVRRVAFAFDAWFMIGKRYDSDITTLLDFDDDWQQVVMAHTTGMGDAHHMDYFVYPRGQIDWDEMPDFYLGRTKWDNWNTANALDHGIPVIDATKYAVAVHQEHGRGHKQAEAIAHNERVMNKRWANIHDARYWLDNEGDVHER